MQHSKSFILSEETREALGYLYREIETLERKINELEDRVYTLEKRGGE